MSDKKEGQTIIINVGDATQSQKKDKAKQTPPKNDKKKVEVNKAKEAFKENLKLTFKGGSSFFKHFFLTLFYALRLFGFALQSYSKEYNKKNKNKSSENKQQDEVLKW